MNNSSVRILTLIIVVLSATDIYAQPDTTNARWHMNSFDHYFFSNDTVVKKAIKFRVTNFAIQGNLDAVKYFYDSRTEKYFGNLWSWSEGIFLYYKNFFMAFLEALLP